MQKKTKKSKKGAKKDVERVGNTRPSQLYQWFFTLNNFTSKDILHLKMRFNEKCKWWIFEEEIGKDGTPHLQGNMSLKIKLRLTSLKKWDKRIHWEPTRNVEAAIEYCQKETVIYTNIELDDFNEYDTIEWRNWQDKIVKEVSVKCSDDRKINWIYDDEGNIGKSFLTKYLMKVENALVVEGKKTDIFHQVAKRKELGQAIPLVIIDVPRSSFNSISYSAIECIKNGFISSGKYEGGQYTFKTPHVYIFANCEPDKSKFSADRWNIIKINKETLEPPAVGGVRSLPCSQVARGRPLPVAGAGKIPHSSVSTRVKKKCLKQSSKTKNQESV